MVAHRTWSDLRMKNTLAAPLLVDIQDLRLDYQLLQSPLRLRKGSRMESDHSVTLGRDQDLWMPSPAPALSILRNTASFRT